MYLTYEGQKALEEITQNEKYNRRVRQEKNNFNNNLPGFLIEEFPVSGNEGLYGWTFVPPDGKIRRREDLKGFYKGIETDLHECGHDKLNDGVICEYLTGLLARERMKSVKPEEKNKYKNQLEEYRK